MYLLKKERRYRSLLIGLTGIVLVLVSCTSRKEQPIPSSAPEPIIVTAPVAGVIRTVLVSDDASVDQGAALLEISMPQEQGATPTDSGGQKSIGSRKADLKLAEDEAARAQTKLQQVQNLVAKGYASKRELDDARVKSEDAQKRLQEARNNSSVANSADNVAKSNAAPRIVAVLAPSTGRVHIIAAQAGQTVKPGEELVQIDKSME